MIRPVLVRREAPLRGGQPLSFAIGLVVALTIGIVLLMGAGHDPLVVYERMFVAALGDPDSWAVTLNRAVPLGLAGLAVAIAGSMGLWNIGAEGQILVGAVFAAGVARVGEGWSGPVLLMAMLAGGAVGGGLWALGPAVARAKIGVNEILTTLMLNEVALRLIQWLIHGPWKDPDSYNFPLAPMLPEQGHLPTLFGRAHIGVVVAVAVIALFAVAVNRTAWGFELRVAGSSGATARYAGISLERKILTVLMLSGAVAGLAGGIELAGTADRLTEGISNGFGFAGIIVAALALMRPSGVAAVALLFGAVQIGGQSIQTLGVSSSVSTILQALILFGAIGAGVLSRYQVRLLPGDPEPTDRQAEA
ncbi:MAG TPA: ABC transporter permease [Acidimicrobiia bacterium]|nr:ABC transporter permease [Acidimicrobiales bacterium]RUA24845.1 MAG: ABC transporter permease [Actinomycetota bacterium]HBL09817.1 ABC transporter permease [Acidimicrobiaceae bacterium]HIM66529.1 ABC transporter permease [Acidimicrobiia bacterium]